MQLAASLRLEKIVLRRDKEIVKVSKGIYRDCGRNLTREGLSVLSGKDKIAYLGTPLELSAGLRKLRLKGPMPWTCKMVSASDQAKW